MSRWTSSPAAATPVTGINIAMAPGGTISGVITDGTSGVIRLPMGARRHAPLASEDQAYVIAALLEISRLDAGAMTPSISSFKMADLMRSLEIEFTPIARAKGLHLIFVPCSLPVQSDRSLLRRLLQNFISNAIKYTPRGRVLVGCRRRGQSLQIGIYDTDRKEIWREKSGAPRTAFAAHTYNEGFGLLGRHPRLINPVEQLFGEKLYMHQYKINAKAKFAGAGSLSPSPKR